MRTVKEVSKLTGVSVRTLHYYDAIGLLKPTRVTEAGYRMYDDAALSRLQNILLFRELQFPLKEIKVILDSPDFNQEEAIVQQIKLLELQYKHIGELISFARAIQTKGVRTMNFEVFDTNEIEQYKTEVKVKWGHSEAYQEYKQRNASQSKCNYDRVADEMMSLFAGFGAIKQFLPADQTVQEKVGALQSYINKNFYTCNKEILKGLGEMYACDERFKKNIDRFGGEGTAEFVRQAILVYCDK
ncbi:Multidrug transporter activation protein [uncultured Roseburia sp.]|uniref:MerR family transcriptional regulator n=1 Tax=Brotonthovivens ammoniilytica TaxID=2981725 RepID=A0ABT2TG32_9FIRM|nr:MerR family transcriptional regulator [Brotonthovivens ammoniilytica]MCU6761143.1 MerR family transcriptional regulator [Brotonthovivens ammoniilytica]SCI20169.1 Multidrug transporter activation protein [uncultured Roseburia sp.]